MLTQNAVSSSLIIMAELHQTSAFTLVAHLLKSNLIQISIDMKLDERCERVRESDWFILYDRSTITLVGPSLLYIR